MTAETSRHADFLQGDVPEMSTNRSVGWGTLLMAVAVLLAGGVRGASAQAGPGAPSGFTAQVSGYDVLFSWGAPATGTPTGYALRARHVAGGPVIAEVPVGLETSTRVTGPAGAFLVSVVAFSGTAAGAESASVSLSLPQAVQRPGPPVALARQVTGTTVTFSWTAPLTGGSPTSYSLVAAASPGGAPMATLPLSPALSLTVPGVPAGTYYVRLVAVNSGGTSDPSNEVQVVVTGPSAPGTPTMQAAGVGQSNVRFAWTPSGSAATSYVLSAALSPGGAPIAELPATDTTYTVPDVPNGTYYVRVRAVNAGGTSGWSNEVPVVVPSPAIPMTVSASGSQTVGTTTLASSSRLAVSWTVPDGGVDHYEIDATDGVAGVTSTSTVAASSTSTTLTLLKAQTTYAVTVRACRDAACQVAARGTGSGATDREYWRMHGTGASTAGLTPPVSDGNARLSATRFGEAGVSTGRIQLYYGPRGFNGLSVATASQAADAAVPASYLTFTSRVGGSGLQSPSPGATLISAVMTGQGVPLSESMGGRVRLFFEAQGTDGRTRIFSIDSKDSYAGLDFNGEASRTVCSTAAEYGPGGSCEPTVAIGVQGDAVEPNQRFTNVRQHKVAWPSMTSPHWDGAAGTFMVFTTDTIAGCSTSPMNHGYAVWSGSRWVVQYASSGCPRLFTSAQAALPMHITGHRYKMYYGDPSVTTGKNTSSSLPWLGPKKLIYADPARSGSAEQADFDDWEAQSAARDVVFLWPDGTVFNDTAEGYIDDYHFLTPTGSLDLQVMYLSITNGTVVPFAATATLVNP